VRLHFKYGSKIYPTKINIRSILRHDVVDAILCCVDNIPEKQSKDIISICRQFGVSLMIANCGSFMHLKIHKTKTIGNHLVHILETSPRNSFKYMLKNLWEFSFASIAILLMLPMFIFIAMAIKLTSKGPLIFKQLRVGLRGRKFYIYKFRTMVADAEKIKASLKDLNEADGPAFKIKNDPRITPVGRLLRKTAMDELPQLFNIITGDMSLIGPRPLVPNEAAEHEDWHLKRLSVKPGITCTWQIKPERNSVSFDEWMQLDNHYVDNWSVWYDIKIFFGTIRSFFKAKGI
jgi:exopolysaccharide biosynthesis polyprenyl glycosylphosphotransferase